MKKTDSLKKLFAKDQLYTEPSDCWVYGYDNSRRHALPEAVIFATSHHDIEKAVQFCFEQNIPLTARGRATNTTGAAVPTQGGIVLSLERMQNIIEFDPINRMVVVEPGVLNQTVQNLAEVKGLFWAPNPTSAPYCSVGGNLACNAAGPRALKYGTTRENTLGLTAVIGTGETIQCGVHTSKGCVGYDLTRLLIGSEGTLGIISQATLKLLPLSPTKTTIRILYQNEKAAAAAVAQIMAQPFTPYGCEFMDGAAIHMIRRHAHADIPESAGSLLLIELEGNSHELKLLEAACQHPDLLDFKIAKNLEEANELWKIRKSLSQALRSLSPHKINEDVIVPVSHLAELLDYTKTLAAQFELMIVNFGHAGNGNIHVNLLVDPFDPIQGPKAQQCLNLLFEKVIALRGSLSGEHGIGIEKRDFMNKEVTPATLALMQKIKSQFDPKGILNPGKLFPA